MKSFIWIECLTFLFSRVISRLIFCLLNVKSQFYWLVLCLTYSNEYTRTLHCLSASLNRPMSMSMISFLRTISFTKHLHCFASFEIYWFTYLQILGVIGVSCVLAKNSKNCVIIFLIYYISRTTVTSWHWGTWCWLTTWRTSRRPHTRSTTSGSGEKGWANHPSSYRILLMWFVLSGLTSSERWWEVPETTGSV